MWLNVYKIHTRSFSNDLKINSSSPANVEGA